MSGGGRGKGAGTGSPLTFRCARCKRGDWRNRSRGTRWKATGERRARRSRLATQRHDGKAVYSYLCLDCGHAGWSRHLSVARAFERGASKATGVTL